MTPLSSEFAGFSPAESREQVPVFFRHGTIVVLNGDGHPAHYLKASGPG